MHPHHNDAKKSMRDKVKTMVGSHKDHEHPYDKGMRLACGGMAEGGSADGPGMIKDTPHLQSLIKNAESDDDLAKIKSQMEKQGLSTDFPAFSSGTLK